MKLVDFDNEGFIDADKLLPVMTVFCQNTKDQGMLSFDLDDPKVLTEKFISDLSNPQPPSPSRTTFAPLASPGKQTRFNLNLAVGPGGVTLLNSYDTPNSVQISCRFCLCQAKCKMLDSWT